MIALLAYSSALLPSPLPAQKNQAAAAATSASRRAILLGAGAASSLALAPIAPAFAADANLFTPAAGSLDGTTILITGANTGLGLESAKRLAAGGARILVTARTKAKADAAAADVGGTAVGVECDLADLASVKALPTRLAETLGTSPTIDVLLNNAGVMAVPERLSTMDGFEKTVGIVSATLLSRAPDHALPSIFQFSA